MTVDSLIIISWDARFNALTWGVLTGLGKLGGAKGDGLQALPFSVPRGAISNLRYQAESLAYVGYFTSLIDQELFVLLFSVIYGDGATFRILSDLQELIAITPR